MNRSELPVVVIVSVEKDTKELTPPVREVMILTVQFIICSEQGSLDRSNECEYTGVVNAMNNMKQGEDNDCNG